VAVGGKLFAIPCHETQILVLDVATYFVSGIPVPPNFSGSIGTFGPKWSGGVHCDGNVYGIPSGADQILVLNVATGLVSGIPVPASVGRGFGKWSGEVAAKGHVYGIPSFADQILVLDVATGKVSGIPVPASVGSGHVFKWSGGATVDGHVYGIPHNADNVLVLEVTTMLVSAIPVPVSVGSGKSKWSGGAVANGIIYGIPSQARNIMVLDPFLRLDLASKLAAVGPLTLQCLDGSTFEVPWPAKIPHDTEVDVRKLAQQMHPKTVLESGNFRLVAVAQDVPSDDCRGEREGALDVTVLDRGKLRGILRGDIPTTITVVFLSLIAHVGCV
jgi:hypothetical protein